MGKQITPDEIGTEVGVRADLKKGRPAPREIKSPRLVEETGQRGGNKAIKVGMSKKVREAD